MVAGGGEGHCMKLVYVERVMDCMATARGEEQEIVR